MAYALQYFRLLFLADIAGPRRHGEQQGAKGKEQAHHGSAVSGETVNRKLFTTSSVVGGASLPKLERT